MEATLDTTQTEVVETPAAPATSEPSQTPAVSQRPGSFEEAFEQVAAKEKATDPAKAPATTTPAGQEPVPSAEKPVGVPPEERWPTILENARSKAIASRDQQWQEKAGWVLSLPPQQQEAAPALVRDFYLNPAMFVANVYSTLKDHPQYGPQLRALIGGNGHGNGHAASSEEGMPQPDVEVIDPRTNQVVSMTYSDKQLAKRDAFLSKQYEQQINQRLAPFEQERQAAKQRAEQAEFDRQAKAVVEQSTDRILKILGGRADLIQHVNALLDSGTHWLDAAIQVRDQHLIPQQQQQATVTAADTMRRKANANTANGSGSPVTPMTRPKTEKDLARMLEELDTRR